MGPVAPQRARTGNEHVKAREAAAGRRGGGIGNKPCHNRLLTGCRGLTTAAFTGFLEVGVGWLFLEIEARKGTQND
jgi:hypothetical protein